MLILPIKRKWFDMILSGEKKEEYREIKDYWTIRFMNEQKRMREELKEKYWKENIEKTEEYQDVTYLIGFRNGYKKNSKYIERACKLRVGQGKEEWGAEKRKRVLHTRDTGGTKC